MFDLVSLDAFLKCKRRARGHAVTIVARIVRETIDFQEVAVEEARKLVLPGLRG